MWEFLDSEIDANLSHLVLLGPYILTSASTTGFEILVGGKDMVLGQRCASNFNCMIYKCCDTRSLLQYLYDKFSILYIRVQFLLSTVIAELFYAYGPRHVVKSESRAFFDLHHHIAGAVHGATQSHSPIECFGQNHR